MAGEDDMAPTRRADDGTLAGLVLRVEGLEGRVENLEHDVKALGKQTSDLKGEVQANTRLTEDIHGSTSTMEGVLTVQTQKTDEMYAAFENARNAIRVITSAGNGLVRVSDVIEKRKATIVLGSVATGIGVGIYTGKMPEWLGLLIKLLA